MIMALLAAFFLGVGIAGTAGGSAMTTAGIKQISERTKVVIVDADRSAAARSTLKDLRKEIKDFEKVFGKSGRQLTRSYVDHAAEREQVLNILADLNSSWEASQQRALDLRFELRDSMTEAEWSELFGTVGVTESPVN